MPLATHSWHPSPSPAVDTVFDSHEPTDTQLPLLQTYRAEGTAQAVKLKCTVLSSARGLLEVKTQCNQPLMECSRHALDYVTVRVTPE
mgnify:CR=1 FL=1